MKVLTVAGARGIVYEQSDRNGGIAIFVESRDSDAEMELPSGLQCRS